jgi:hypothetical protein
LRERHSGNRYINTKARGGDGGRGKGPASGSDFPWLAAAFFTDAAPIQIAKEVNCVKKIDLHHGFLIKAGYELTASILNLGGISNSRR